MGYVSFQVDLDDLWVLKRSRDLIKDSSFFSQGLSMINEVFVKNGVPVTLFVVGRDIQVPAKKEILLRSQEKSNSDMLLELANHTMDHDNQIGLLDSHSQKEQILQCDFLIREELGVECRGFRSPGYVFSDSLLAHLVELNYLYDSSLLPSSIGPILRFMNRLAYGVKGKYNFGGMKNWRLPNGPWKLSDKMLFELPVTVMPIFRLPIHYSILPPKLFCIVWRLFVRRLPKVVYLFHLRDMVNSRQADLLQVVRLILKSHEPVLAKVLGTI